MTFPVLGGNGAVAGYQIDNSLRFNDDDSAYLTRSTGTTNKKTFTVSVWVKRTTLNARQTIWASDQNTNDTGDGSKGGSGNYISFWNNGAFMFGGFGGSFQVRADGLQRDVSAWYHIVAQTDTTQATTNNRAKLWINGVQQTTYTSMIAQNVDVKWATNRIGVRSDVANYSDAVNLTAYADGYIAELHVIDGQALEASDFGEYDEDSGIWKPKEYTGSYGSDGYYLDFENSGSLGADQSGNGNNFTPTNLASTDQTTDTPTNNFATLNYLDTYNSPTLSEGNTKIVRSSGYGIATGTVAMKTGKWYWEIQCPTVTTSGENESFGISKVTSNIIGNNYIGLDTNSWALILDNATDIYFNHNNSFTDSGINASNGDIFMFALDADTGKLWFGRNGTWFDSGNPSAGTNQKYTANTDDVYYVAVSMNGNDATLFNFGNPAFSISSGNSDENGYGNFEYAPPTGFLALCTQNLATALSPTIDDGSAYFHTQLYTGDGQSSKVITNDANAGDFQPDWVWIKERSSTSAHLLFDSTRGTDKRLRTNGTNAEETFAYLSSFDTDGFTIGTSDAAINENTQTYVAWQWLANGGTTSSNTDGDVTSTVQVNSTSKFSIFTYTGNGNNLDTVGHGLGTTPDFCVIKGRSSGASGTQRWFVKVPAVCGASEILELDTTNAKGDSGNGIETMSSTTVTLGIDTGNANGVNESGLNYVGYAFASVEGYSKIGSYTGNGSTDGTFVYTGFRPAFVIYKRSDAVENWQVLDAKRDIDNPVGQQLYPNLSASEGTENRLDFTSNGFKFRNSGTICNASGGSYIYMCFAENPFVSSSGVPVVAR